MVSNSELREELIQSQDAGIMSNKLFNLLHDLTYHYASRKFKTDKSLTEAVDVVTTNIIEHKRWNQFKPEKLNNARAYMGQIIRCQLADYSLKKYRISKSNK